MIGEVISIGDELTSGQRLDTNSQWLSERLGELGVRVVYHTTVADDLDANVAVFRQAIARADVVVASGGLGPTADDLTRDALAAAVGVPLELDEEQLRHIESLFSRRKRPMPERNRVQAFFPRGSRPIFNAEGTAPGITLAAERVGRGACHVFALPGVPAEMKPMFLESVAPAVAKLAPAGRTIVHRRIKCYGAGESHLEAMLPDLIRRGREPSVGITVHKATITLRITATGSSAAECADAMEPTVATIRESLGTLVFGDEDDELQDVVVRELRAAGRTLATVEWGTAGLVADWLGATPGADDVYRGGLVVTTAESAARLLPGVRDVLSQHGPWGPAAPAALARETQAVLGVDYALAIGALPALGERFHIALATAGELRAASGVYAGHADILKDRVAKDGLNLLRLALPRS